MYVRVSASHLTILSKNLGRKRDKTKTDNMHIVDKLQSPPVPTSRHVRFPDHPAPRLHPRFRDLFPELHRPPAFSIGLLSLVFPIFLCAWTGNE
jgi:hypothetical protein